MTGCNLSSALRDWNDLLEDRIAQRTAQLEAEQHERAMAESKLRQSQKMEAVGQLTGGIAHDFNNLLAGIIGSLELMQRRIDAGQHNQLTRYNSVAMTSASRAAALTQRLLAFSRQQSLEPELLEPRTVVAGLEEMIRRTVGPSIVVECSFRASDRIRCDLNQLENALLNLAINARDAMPDGGTLNLMVDRCTIDAAASADRNMPQGTYVSISVTDSGTGISPDILSRIFDPFFTTKKIGEGTGLGLSMIYGFTQQSGGQIKVHSSLGVGTTVTMYFPVDRSLPGHSRKSQRSAFHATGCPQRSHPAGGRRKSHPADGLGVSERDGLSRDRSRGQRVSHQAGGKTRPSGLVADGYRFARRDERSQPGCGIQGAIPVAQCAVHYRFCRRFAPGHGGCVHPGIAQAVQPQRSGPSGARAA
ncbi:hypothetical protein JFT80_20935 [Pseudomonas sp. TH10]|nr:hypothetical protein [Pseudomonas sp. TH10]